MPNDHIIISYNQNQPEKLDEILILGKDRIKGYAPQDIQQREKGELYQEDENNDDESLEVGTNEK